MAAFQVHQHVLKPRGDRGVGIEDARQQVGPAVLLAQPGEFGTNLASLALNLVAANATDLGPLSENLFAGFGIASDQAGLPGGGGIFRIETALVLAEQRLE